MSGWLPVCDGCDREAETYRYLTEGVPLPFIHWRCRKCGPPPNYDRDYEAALLRATPR